ncbi:hypothetical protein ACA910_002991 [Epithemia clementina (nom. ined.)]
MSLLSTLLQQQQQYLKWTLTTTTSNEDDGDGAHPTNESSNSMFSSLWKECIVNNPLLTGGRGKGGWQQLQQQQRQSRYYMTESYGTDAKEIIGNPNSSEEEQEGYWSSSNWWTTTLLFLVILYLMSELVFLLYFYLYLIPQANQLRTADIYHDYPEPEDRVRLCRRILLRLKQKAVRLAAAAAAETKQDNKCAAVDKDDVVAAYHQQVIRDFLLQWFDYIPPPENKTALYSTPEKASSSSSRPTQTASKQLPLLLLSSSSSVSLPPVPPRANLCQDSAAPAAAPIPSLAGTVSSSSVGSDASSVQSCDGSGRSRSASSFSSYSPCCEAAAASATGELKPWTIPGLRREAVRDFFAWAFFAKNTADLTAEEQVRLEQCFNCIRELSGLILLDSSSMEDDDNPSLYQPRRLSLEKVQALHRPWILYAIIAATQFATRTFILPWLGFRRVEANHHNSDKTSSGHRQQQQQPLVAWYRPAKSPPLTGDKNQRQEVCLFFHGIAPAGVICYLPMIQALLGGSGRQSQDLILVENPSVSCQFHWLPNFHGLTEQETVQGIQDILQQLGLSTTRHDLTLMGHSFGSCPITWILRRRNELGANLKEVILLDPVTLLLSEPTVMSRFLYERDSDKAHIRFLVASELFTEYYLRRHFCWYNSELWLEDFIPIDNDNTIVVADNQEEKTTDERGKASNNPAKWTIVLSGRDEIVPSPVIQEHIQNLKDQHNFHNCNLIYWPHSKHANCVMSPRRWELMKTFLFRSSNNINNEEKQGSNSNNPRHVSTE